MPLGPFWDPALSLHLLLVHAPPPRSVLIWCPKAWNRGICLWWVGKVGVDMATGRNRILTPYSIPLQETLAVCEVRVPLPFRIRAAFLEGSWVCP